MKKSFQAFGVLILNIKSDFTFENFQNFVIKKHMEGYLKVQKISSTPQQTRCYGKTRHPREIKIIFVMLPRLILKVIKLQLPTPKHFSTVVKNIFFFWGGGGTPHVK